MKELRHREVKLCEVGRASIQCQSWVHVQSCYIFLALQLQSRGSLFLLVALQRMDLHSPMFLPSKEGPAITNEGIFADIPNHTPQLTCFGKWSEEKFILKDQIAKKRLRSM